jgi:hypothetical protein
LRERLEDLPPAIVISRRIRNDLAEQQDVLAAYVGEIQATIASGLHLRAQDRELESLETDPLQRRVPLRSRRPSRSLTGGEEFL